MKKRLLNRSKSAVSALLISAFIMMQLSAAGASTTVVDTETGFSETPVSWESQESHQATPSESSKATPSEPIEVLPSDLENEDLLLPDDEILSWDDYVINHPEEFLATPSDFISVPQQVDMSAADSAAPLTLEPQTRAGTVIRYSVLLLDTSGSMSGIPLTRTKDAAIKFCDQVLNARGENYVAVISFNGSAFTVHGFSNDFSSLSKSINRLGIGGGTNQGAALTLADTLLKRVTTPGAVKNILLLSDGLPESGEFSNTGPYTSSDHSKYQYANAIYEKAGKLKKDYFIYTLGFFHQLSGKDLEFGQRFMDDLQNAGYYEVINPDDLEFEFGEIVGNLLKQTGKFKYAGMFNSSRDVEATYHYNDAYFLSDSQVYNPMLATMSLCLELTSWASHDTNHWPEKCQNAENLLTGSEGLGFKDFARSLSWNQRPTQDSIGAVAANKTITDYKDTKKDYTLIALAVRGGGYGSEWASNFTVGESGTHSGFTSARDQVLEFLEDYIEAYGITGNIKLWIVGYSRGGATANMVGGALDDGYHLPNVSLKKENLYVYTFEAPQGALEDESYGNYTNIHNIINLNDPVPLVAPYKWGFTRYNTKKDFIFPADFSSDIFATQRDKMLNEFEKLEGISKDDYTVQEYSTKKIWKVDKTAILPDGEPLILYESSKISQFDVLFNTVDFLSKDVLKSRSNYYQTLEDDVREVAGVLYDGSGRDRLFLENLSFQLSSPSTMAKMLAPIFISNPPYTLNMRLADIRKNVKKVIRQAVDESNLNISSTALDTLDQILCDTLEQTAIDIWNNDTDNLNLIIELSDLIKQGSIQQAHYPEICLAWLMSLDPNYSPSADMQKVPAAFRIIRINCPVDISVYDSSGSLAASIIGDQTQDEINRLFCTLNEKGEKIIYLPANEDYQIEITATGDGEMTYSVNEFNLITNRISRLVNYYRIPIVTGDIFTGLAPSFGQSDTENGIPDGSSVSYQLLNNAGVISGSEEISGSDVENNYFRVSVKSDNDSGYVNGTGNFIKGSYAKAEAMPLSGSSLLGWYIDDRLVSTDSIYRFPVTQETTITARFTPVEKHPMRLEAEKGGEITSVEGYYTIGTKVAVVAEAKEGYVFKNWTTSDGAGSFTDSGSAYTTFIMPDREVTVTACFEPADPIWYSIAAAAGTGGTVSGNGTFLSGADVTLFAVPEKDYIFDGWFEEGRKILNADASYSFTVTKDRSLKAHFRKPPSRNTSAENAAPVPSLIPETPGSWYQAKEGWQYLMADKTPYKSTWIYVSGEWYWINSASIMAEGWQNINQKRYFLLPANGAMVTGWYQEGTAWYYLDETGAMCTGWITVNGTWYYLDGSGKMLTDTITPDGFSVDSNGAWITK